MMKDEHIKLLLLSEHEGWSCLNLGSFSSCPSGREYLWKVGSQIQGHKQYFGHAVLWMTISEEVKAMVTVNIIVPEHCRNWGYLLLLHKKFSIHVPFTSSRCKSLQSLAEDRFEDKESCLRSGYLRQCCVDTDAVMDTTDVLITTFTASLHC